MPRHRPTRLVRSSMTVTAPGTRMRLGYLDSIRALAAGYVVLHHIWFTVWPFYPRNGGPWWTGWLVYGHLAVAVFIVLSGFSLSLEPIRHGHRLPGGLGRFARRRAWRIIPPYWAALVASVLVLLYVTGPRDQVTLKGIVVHALLLQDLIGSPTPNGAFWSIAVEWQIYFAFPFLLWWRRRFGILSTVLASTLMVTATYLGSQYFTWMKKTQDLTPQFLVLFVLGMAGAELAAGRPGRANRINPVVLGGLGGAAVVLYVVVAGSVAVDSNYFWIDLMAGACAAAVIAGLGMGHGRFLRAALSHRLARFFGRFSYSTYLVHLPILAPVWMVIDPMDQTPVAKFLVFIALGLPAVYVASWLFSTVFEAPFIRHRSLGQLSDAWATGVRARRPRLFRSRRTQPASPTAESATD